MRTERNMTVQSRRLFMAALTHCCAFPQRDDIVSEVALSIFFLLSKTFDEEVPREKTALRKDCSVRNYLSPL